MKRSSFNAFGQFGVTTGENTPIWCGTPSPVPVGGSLAQNYVKKGLFLPAGTPVYLADKVATPVLVYTVKAYASGVSTIDLSEHPGFVPAAGMYVSLVGATFSTSNGTAITAVAANTDGTASVTAAVSGAAAGKYIVISVEAKVIPNGYLYNDVYLGDIDTDLEKAGASCAVIQSHAEGILIDRTPAAGIADAMKAAVPCVIQVKG